MKMEMIKNDMNNNYLCHIQGTKQAYYIKSLKEAKQFVQQVNNDLESGRLKFIGNKLIKKY